MFIDDFKLYQGHVLPFVIVNAIKELRAEKDLEIGELREQNDLLRSKLCAKDGS
ncbi:hypothetical protein KAS08_06210 [Candidatus Pacearchaeota archaeon]|nr:hypothetical protein [Candidatus Pacearchaeota archaeon]